MLANYHFILADLRCTKQAYMKFDSFLLNIVMIRLSTMLEIVRNFKTCYQLYRNNLFKAIFSLESLICETVLMVDSQT